MRRRRGLFNVSRWAGLFTVALVVVAYLVSGWWELDWFVTASWGVGITKGAMAVGWTGSHDRPTSLPSAYAEHHPAGREALWWLRAETAAYGNALLIPLWMPLLFVAAPTALLWRDDWRAWRLARKLALAVRCASCGYDRAGLAVGVKCPECGALPTTPSAWPLAKTPDP